MEKAAGSDSERRIAVAFSAVSAVSAVVAVFIAAASVGLALGSCGLARAMGDGDSGPDIPVADTGGPALESLKPGRAVLVEGAAAVKGIPGFGLNVLPAVFGRYAYVPKAPAGTSAGSAADTPLMIPVWFTRVRLAIPASWAKPIGADAIKGFSVLAAPAAADGSSLWALSSSGYAILVELPPGVADAKRFVSVFAERFAFFYRYAERPEDVSFPAILDVAAP